MYIIKKEVVVVNKKKDALMKTLLKETVAVIHSAFEDSPRTVAMVNVDKSMSESEKLEFAFKKTNSIDSAWWRDEDVTPMFGNEFCRSTSIGDMVLIGTDKFKLNSDGWSKI